MYNIFLSSVSVSYMGLKDAFVYSYHMTKAKKLFNVAVIIDEQWTVCRFKIVSEI